MRASIAANLKSRQSSFRVSRKFVSPRLFSSSSSTLNPATSSESAFSLHFQNSSIKPVYTEASHKHSRGVSLLSMGLMSTGFTLAPYLAPRVFMGASLVGIGSALLFDRVQQAALALKIRRHVTKMSATAVRMDGTGSGVLEWKVIVEAEGMRREFTTVRLKELVAANASAKMGDKDARGENIPTLGDLADVLGILHMPLGEPIASEFSSPEGKEASSSEDVASKEFTESKVKKEDTPEERRRRMFPDSPFSKGTPEAKKEDNPSDSSDVSKKSASDASSERTTSERPFDDAPFWSGFDPSGRPLSEEKISELRASLYSTRVQRKDEVVELSEVYPGEQLVPNLAQKLSMVLNDQVEVMRVMMDRKDVRSIAVTTPRGVINLVGQTGLSVGSMMFLLGTAGFLVSDKTL